MHRNLCRLTVTGAFPQTRLGQFTDPLAGFIGFLRGRTAGGKGKGDKKREREVRRQREWMGERAFGCWGYRRP